MMAKINLSEKIFYRLGEKLCLDFVNTVGFHAGENPNEWLTNYERLALWGWEAGALKDKNKLESLLEHAESFPDKAQVILRQAIDLREAMYRIFCATVQNEPVQLADMSILNSQLVRATDFLKIECNEENEFFMIFNDDNDQLDSLLWPVVKSAVDLLTSHEINKVKQCEGGTCGWLFIDTSRNHSRRWCSMEECGNREKARRHYRKKNSQK